MAKTSELKEKKKKKKELLILISFLLIYIFWTIEAIFPFHFPEISLVFVVLISLNEPPLLSSLLGFFLGFLLDSLSPVSFGRWTLFFSLLALLFSRFQAYIIFSYPYLFSIIFFALLLKGIIGGFNSIRFLLTLLIIMPSIKIFQKWFKK